jgi:DeoR/GlpR family transcriptional regulator of sugar metabolism
VTDPVLRSEAAVHRRTWVLTTLRRVGFLAVNDVARELGVSHMTVRRDLHAMQQAGEVRMVHGGASLPTTATAPAFADDGNEAGRARVAEWAAAMVAATETIVLDAGPTPYAVARALPADFRGSVITHSMPVLRLLEEEPGAVTAVALGGELLPVRHAFFGPTTEAALEQLRARTFFLEPAAVDGRGLYARTPAEANLQRRMIEIADRVVVVATHEVYATSAPARIASLDRLTALVNDEPLPRTVAAVLQRADIAAHIADY